MYKLLTTYSRLFLLGSVKIWTSRKYGLLLRINHYINRFQLELDSVRPSIPNLRIINRNLYNGEFHDTIPRRIGCNASLIIEECERFYPNKTGILERSASLVEKLSKIRGTDGIEVFMDLLRTLQTKKPADTLILDCGVSVKF